MQQSGKILTPDELLSLLTAAMTVEGARGAPVRGSSCIELDIAYDSHRRAAAMGDWTLGPAYDLVTALLDGFQVIASRCDGEERQPGYIRFERAIPVDFSGHEVLAAGERLTATLKDLGIDESEIARMVSMEDKFWRWA